ncbi:MAG: Gfo/Idh/MocA family oxidoreductase [Armatimonadota bacterium]|nr:Gfo/Idh/MocA family oxidoreductase [Armatimonadota bacterium]
MTRLGIMSFAHLHADFYATAIAGLDDVEVAGVWDDNADRGREKAAEYDTRFFPTPEELFAPENEIQGAIVTSENINHKRDVLAAAEGGVDILCEKPISVSVEDAQVMIDECDRAGVQLMISFPCRYSPAFGRLLEMVREGDLGEILCIKGTNRGENPGGWFNDPELAGGGAIIDHTVHVVDMMRTMLEEEVVKVYAEIDTLFDPDLPCDDAGILSMNFEGGCMATLDASWSRPDNYPIWGDVTMAVIGTGGNAWADLFVERVDVWRVTDGTYLWEPYGHDANAEMIADFARCVETGAPVPITGFDGLKAMEVALGAYRSAEINEPVGLPLA